MLQAFAFGMSHLSDTTHATALLDFIANGACDRVIIVKAKDLSAERLEGQICDGVVCNLSMEHIGYLENLAKSLCTSGFPVPDGVWEAFVAPVCAESWRDISPEDCDANDARVAVMVPYVPLDILHALYKRLLPAARPRHEERVDERCYLMEDGLLSSKKGMALIASQLTLRALNDIEFGKTWFATA